MSNQLTNTQLCPDKTALPWSAYGRVSVLERWANELASIVREGGSDRAWQLAGRAVMITHQDASQHQLLVSKVAHAAGMNLLNVDPEVFVQWVLNKSYPVESAPALIFIPQGAWSSAPEEGTEVPEDIKNFKKTIPEYLQKIVNNCPLVFITTGDSYDNLDPELRAVGVFDRRFDVIGRNVSTLGQFFLEEVGLDLCDDTLLKHVDKVGKLIVNEFDEKRRERLIALSMKRRANQQQRQLNFNDLVYFAVHGGGEADTEDDANIDNLHRSAVHEAGHALICMLDSNGANIPDYAGVVGFGKTLGIVADSYTYLYSTQKSISYFESRHKIRVALAGRIAESIVLGSINVSTFGARSDLRLATSLANDLVGLCGFTYDYDAQDNQASNLAVIQGEPTPSEAAHIELQSRKYLEQQYKVVEKCILDHRNLLDLITESLLEKRMLNQSELTDIWSKNNQLLDK